MKILFFNEDVSLPVFSKSKISNWITRCIIDENFQVGTINFIFVSDDYLLKMNRQYLNHDYFTDVISFDYCEEKTVSGDIFMSVDRIRDNASDLELDFTDEVFRVMIHGILHLMGYHDKTGEEKKQMRAKEDEALGKMKE
ncbi:MAG: rRNA maturation RNase YbeY [Bacteroidales bacterium]|nr:rRNA maturation RNase YbeY [Bacteroidales bacterium]